MDDCPILWGQPLYYDVDATYIGRCNVYLFWWYDKKIILVSHDEQFLSTIVDKRENDQ